jgi:phosphohistidine phosphatase
MTDLYILRHGIAVNPGTPGIADDERPLTAKGEKRMRQIARGLRALDLEIDRIVASPLVRARATAEIVARELAMRNVVEVANILQTGSSAPAIKRWLRNRPEERLMIVGHNPTLSDLISLLVIGSEQPLVCDLKKGGIAALTRASAAAELYQVAWIAPPRVFRRINEIDGNDD